MSDEQVAPQGAEADAGPIEATATEATEPVTEAPPVEYLDIDDDLATKHVRIKVDGEETSVPLSELTQGYQRQSDYTRKTQELAQQRQEAEAAIQLQRAFQANPGMTVQILAQRSGVSVEQFLGLSNQQQNAVAQAVAAEDDYADPLERALAEERAARLSLEERLNQREANELIARTVDGLRHQFQASDEDIQATIRVAMENDLPPNMLPMIYQSIAFQKLAAQQQARTQASQQQTAAEQARQAAAAAAGQVVSAGTGATGTTPDPATDGRMSLSDAIAAAVSGFPD